MDATLYVQMLGGFRAVYRGTDVPKLHMTRAESLLARLLLQAGVVQSRAHLAFVLWPDSGEAQAHTNLRKLLHTLKQLLPDLDRFVAMERHTLCWRLDAPYIFDVAEFKSALTSIQKLSDIVRAVSLYRGDLLPDNYDDWLAGERERLRQAFTHLLEKGVVMLEAERDYATALRYARRIVEHDPLHEPGYLHVMRLLATSGDRAGALDTYRTCVTVLQTELDIEPSADTRAFHARLLKPGASGRMQPPAEYPLVNRAQEWKQLQAAWHAALAGEPHVVVLTGALGIGKTRLAEELQRSMGRQGVAHVSAACAPEDMALTYAPVARLLRARPLPTLSDDQLVEVARIIPEVLKRQPALAPPVPMTRRWQQHRLFAALAHALVAHGPHLVVLDDAQWCDQGTQEFLDYLLHASPDPRLLIVCTLPEEPEEAGITTSTLLTSGHAERVQHIEVPPLAEESAAQLARHVAKRPLDGPVLARVLVETGGNPGAIIKAARAASHPTRTPAAARVHNLPAQPTPLIGRTHEVARAHALLRRPDVRLLTITGVGGIGKTRLALQIAEELLRGFNDGISLVALASVSDPEHVASTVAQTLGVRPHAAQTALEALKEHLQRKHLLLVLDNFEHLLPAGLLIADLIRSCQQLKILVTSRVPLHLYGEYELPVPPLTVPARGVCDVATVGQSDAVQLFVQRADMVMPGFALTAENAAIVAELCARLDGVPLAIELAAAHTRRLDLHALLARLSSRLELLVDGPRDMPERQRTLRSTIVWSYNLLEEQEQQLFARLAVFAHSCSVAAAQAVCDSDRQLWNDLAAGLASLTDKSLLQRVDGPAPAGSLEPRFVMLETLHEYAAERLKLSGEADVVARRHAEYYLALAKEAAHALQGADQAAWLDRLEGEQDNLRAALTWSLASGAIDLGLRLTSALRRFWDAHSHLSEGRKWLAAVLAQSGEQPADLRARALSDAGWLAAYQGDYAAARALLDESVALFQEVGDQEGAAEALNNLGNVAVYQGEYEQAKVLYEASLAVYRELGDTRRVAAALNNLGNVAMYAAEYEHATELYQQCLVLLRSLEDTWRIAAALSNLGNVAMYQNEYERAVGFLEESLALRRQLGDTRGIAAALTNLGLAVLEQGGYRRAEALLTEALALFGEVGDKEGTAYCLEGLAQVAAGQQEALRAAHLFGAADGLRAAIGAPLPAIDQAKYAPYVAAVRSQLPPAQFDIVFEQGQYASLEQSVEVALRKAPQL